MDGRVRRSREDPYRVDNLYPFQLSGRDLWSLDLFTVAAELRGRFKYRTPQCYSFMGRLLGDPHAGPAADESFSQRASICHNFRWLVGQHPGSRTRCLDLSAVTRTAAAQPKVKAIIIGGGIGGLTVAIALSKVGIDAQVYERAPVLREVGAGIVLSGMALHVLDGLGLGSAVRSQSIEGIQGDLRSIKGNVLFAIPADEFSRRLGVVAVLHRAELLALLTQQVDPGRIHLGREFAGFEQDNKGVTVWFENGETAQGHVLVGADGVKSAVRTQLIGERPLRYAGYTAWRSVVESDHSRNLNIVETWGRGRRFGIVPMSRGRIYWFATNNAPEGERDLPGRSRQILSNLFRGWHEPIEALIEAANEDSILRNDIYDLGPLQRWVHNRVALLGDAAHPMTPNLGQGACQAIEDAVVLAAYLCRSERVDSALIEYQRRRLPRASQIVLRSRLFGLVAQCNNPVLCWMRDTTTRLTPSWVAARQLKSPLGFDMLTPSESRLFQNQPHDGAS